MTIMRCPFRPPHEDPGRERRTAGNIFSKRREEFEKMIAKDELIEYAMYVNNYYGTPKAYVQEQLAEGKDVILEIEVQGALKVKEKFPDTPLIFVTPPTASELKTKADRQRDRKSRSGGGADGDSGRRNPAAWSPTTTSSSMTRDRLEECVESVARSHPGGAREEYAQSGIYRTI